MEQIRESSAQALETSKREALARIDRLRESIADYGCEGAVNWGHVGRMNRANELLAELLRSMGIYE